MKNKSLAIGLLVAGLVLFAVFIVVACDTMGPKLATGAQVTTNGYAALISSFLGASGLTVAGVISAIAGHFLPSTKTAEVAEIVELTTSFAGLIKDKTNRAAQRRFIFALVDSTSMIPGVSTSHENNVVVIKYSGYADPVVA
jgi:hypothetical protein